jgi:hypothetical protein
VSVTVPCAESRIGVEKMAYKTNAVTNRGRCFFFIKKVDENFLIATYKLLKMNLQT